MNNFRIVAACVVAGFAVCACVRETAVDGVTPGEITLTAYQEQKTKTTLVEQTEVYWKPSDEIKVFSAGESAKFISQNTEDAAIADFKGSISVVSGSNEGSGSEASIYALYPYREESSFADGTITTSLSAVQSAVTGTFADDLFISIGRSNSLSVPFYNVCSGIRFTVEGEGIKAVELKGNAGESIAGSFVAGFGEDGKPVVSGVDAPETSIRLNAPDGGTFTPGEQYFIVSLPRAFESGITLSFIKEGLNAERVISTPVTLKRSIFGNLANADRGCEYSEFIDKDAQLAREREALIAIYNALDGGSWTYGYNNNWCSDMPVNEWYGININAEGYVESLYLTGTGMIPSELESLSSLKRLTINYHRGNTNYEISSSIFKLQNLEYLHLYGEQLTGTIPSEIGKLQNLKHLEINDTNIGGRIPSSLGELRELEYLDLEWNKLTGELPESLGNLKNLRHVMLRQNELSGNIPRPIQELPIWKYDWGRIIDQNHFNEKSMIVPAPTIHGTTFDNRSYIYDEHTDGYNVLIQWSAQYDGYLASQIESLNQIYSKYNDLVSFVGLVSSSRELGKDAVETYITENNILWPSLFWTYEDNVIDGQELSFDGISRHEYAAPCFPAIFVFYNGRVVYWDLDVYGGVSGLDDYLSVNVLGEQPNYYVSTDFSSDGEVTVVQTASIGNGINIVLMGDAYSDRELKDGKYASNLNNIIDAFFSEEPFKTYRSFFNVYLVNVVSSVEGYEHDGQALNTFFGSGTFVGGNNAKCIEYAKKCLNDDSLDDAVIVVSMNDDRYAGTCHMFGEEISGDYGRGLSIAYFPHGNLEDITHHEASGHGFAKLADEYAYDYMGAIPEDAIADTRVNEAYGWWKNVDFTSDPSQVKWSQFISDERYASENIGCYEGGLTYWTGVWRPTEASIMRHNTGGFNAPSRYAIWYRIGKLAYGESWEGSYEDFVAYDAVNRTPKAKARKAAQIHQAKLKKPLPPLPAPVVVGHSWREELQKN